MFRGVPQKNADVAADIYVSLFRVRNMISKFDCSFLKHNLIYIYNYILYIYISLEPSPKLRTLPIIKNLPCRKGWKDKIIWIQSSYLVWTCPGRNHMSSIHPKWQVILDVSIRNQTQNGSQFSLGMPFPSFSSSFAGSGSCWSTDQGACGSQHEVSTKSVEWKHHEVS